MRVFVISLAFFLVLQNPAPSAPRTKQPKQPQSAASQQAVNPDQRGTEQSPVIVKVVPTTKTQEEAEEDAQERKTKVSSDWWTVFLTGTLAFIAFLQLLVYTYQAKKLRETVKSAEGQSKAMERHIGEAARSANAMENVANVIQFGNKAVMRAYLTVVAGTAIHQERREPGQPDLKFEARPELRNTGNTPARNVGIRIKADILTLPIPDDFRYALPDEPSRPGFGGVLGAHQMNSIFGIVDRFVPDAEVGLIKEGTRKALCVWGLVTYEDIFGDHHTTRFGQIIQWYPNGSLFVYFVPGQNDSD